MARSPKLKVYRTPIGFHDAYVAAPSQKAALEAWGSDSNLFARGEADLVDDPALTAEPLSAPGKVIKRLRGTAAEQIAALPASKPAKKGARSGPEKPARAAKPRPEAKPAPRPSRAGLDKAEAVLSTANERHKRDLQKIADREAALRRERRALEQKHAEARKRLEAERDEAAAVYEKAMRSWRG
jgi:hypothetical protein